MRAALYFSIFLFATQAKAKAPYPDEWWAEVDRSTAPDWEILPQDANRSKGEVILSKRNELGILSNFAETPVRFVGELYPGIEGFWQMMKYPEGENDPRLADPSIEWPHTRAQVSKMVGFAAKEAGNIGSANMQKLKINWVTYKGKQMVYRTSEKGEHYDLIVAAMWQKLQQNPKVKEILLKTGDLKLLPDHKQEEGTSPAWKYFEIWMELRSRLH